MAVALVDELRARPLRLVGGPIAFTVSCGVATLSPNSHVERAEFLAIAAERARRAVEEGGDRVVDA